MKENSSNYSVQVLERALDILCCYIGNKKELSIADVSRLCSLSVTTTSRIMRTMEAKGFLFRNTKTKEFSLGRNVFLLGYHAKENDLLHSLLYPYLLKLRDEFNQNAIIYVRDGDCRLCYDFVPSNSVLRYDSRIGARYEMWAGAGAKVFLAYMTEEEISEILSKAYMFTPYTVIGKKLLEEIKAVRNSKIAISKDEYQEGFSSLAVPVFGKKEQLLCTIALTGITSDFTNENIKKMAKKMLEYSAEASEQLRRWAVI